MDRAAKELFTGCSLIFLFFAVDLGLGCWTLLVEFGYAFSHSEGDHPLRELSHFALVVINPFGSIGWYIGIKNLVPNSVGVSVFIIGSVLSALLYGSLVSRFLGLRRNKRKIVEQVIGHLWKKYRRNNSLNAQTFTEELCSRQVAIQIRNLPDYEDFLADDQQRRFLYDEDLPKEFAKWHDQMQRGEQTMDVNRP